MAISALDASKLVDGGNFGGLDLEELYTALSSDDKYAVQLDKLRSVMEGKLKGDIEAMSKIADAAEAVAKLDENTNPLDEKNADFAAVRSGLSNLSFDSSSEKTEYNDIIKNIVAAAKLETVAELRGLSSPESPESKAFYVAGESKRKQIYNETLSKNVELAILTMALGEEVAKSLISLNKEAANKADLDKKVEDFKKTLVDDVAKKFDAVSKFGKPDMPKVELSENTAIAYCANAEQKAVACLKEYGESFQKLGDKISTGFEKLTSDTSKQMKETWDKSKDAVSKRVAKASENVEKGINSFGKGCKKVWGKSYTVASAAAKKAWESRYEIAADAAAAAAFGLTVGTGGTAAVVGGIGYGVYTLGRRIVYEAYKAKKLNPEKSYKEIYKDPKFITKGIFAVAAAGISGSIGISAGLDTAADIVAQKLARRSATVLGSITSGAVGVINAKDKEERKKEWLGLGVSTAAGIGGLLLGELLGGKTAANQATVVSKPVANAGDWKWGSSFAPEQTPINEQEGVTVPYAPGYPEAQTEVEAASAAVPEFEFKDFPSEYNSEMGITKAQFINLRKIILKNGDEAQLDRLYSNATRFAQSVSVEGGKTLTAEEVLFKFTRAAAWTTKMDKDFWSQSQTGAFGPELTALKKMLECGDAILVQETLIRARGVLDAVNANGSLNADKSFNLVSELSKYNEVNAKGEIVGKTNNILVGMGTKNCDPEQKNFQFAKGGASKVKVEVVKAPDPKPELPKVNIPPLSPTPVKLEVPTPKMPEIKVAPAPVADPVVETPKPSSIALGAKANFSETPGREGVNSIDNLDPSKAPDAITAGQAGASKDMLKDLHKSGKITDEQYNQGLELLKVAKKNKDR